MNEKILRAKTSPNEVLIFCVLNILLLVDQDLLVKIIVKTYNLSDTLMVPFQWQYWKLKHPGLTKDNEWMSIHKFFGYHRKKTYFNCRLFVFNKISFWMRWQAIQAGIFQNKVWEMKFERYFPPQFNVLP